MVSNQEESKRTPQRRQVDFTKENDNSQTFGAIAQTFGAHQNPYEDDIDQSRKEMSTPSMQRQSTIEEANLTQEEDRADLKSNEQIENQRFFVVSPKPSVLDSDQPTSSKSAKTHQKNQAIKSHNNEKNV